MGQHANPHPSQEGRYEVKVIAETATMVRVRYVYLTAEPWWITHKAWDWWAANSQERSS